MSLSPPPLFSFPSSPCCLCVHVPDVSGCAEICSLTVPQIGFLTEWQLYAQKIEGDSWRGEKLDRGKIEKMSGKLILVSAWWLAGWLMLLGTDQQMGQLYELMKAIRTRDLKGEDEE